MRRINIKSIAFILTIVMLGTGGILAGSHASADDMVDEVEINVPVSCTMSGNGMTSHSAEIANGTTNSSIGETTINAYCNDAEGFAIYTVGYTDNTEGKNVLTNASLGSTYDIATGTGTSGNSQWAMKVTTQTDPEPTYPVTIENDFDSFHTVPDDYTLVAKRESATDIGQSATGSTIKTTYQAYISNNQPAGTYTGQVKYVLVHPSSMVAGRLNVIYDGNGLTFEGGRTTNLVTYDALTPSGEGEIRKKVYTNAYNEVGEYSGSGIRFPSGNRVVTIPDAEKIHIMVKYGAPQGSSGPPSDLSIWAGNYPDYTDANADTALTSCGETNAINGAFSSTGQEDTQVIMECDIVDDSVTFYDYSTGTSNNYSMGYYAVVNDPKYDKTVYSGTYITPDIVAGRSDFFGWSTSPHANADGKNPTYVNETDFIENSSYSNIDNTVVLYAVWGKTFDAAFDDAGKSKVDGYYKMQDITKTICDEVSVGSFQSLVDIRDNTVYVVKKLKDGKCWMLNNLALDPTDSDTRIKLDASNTNASAEAISNYLVGGSTNTGWSNVAVANIENDFNDATDDFFHDGYATPRINNYSKDTYVPGYGQGATGNQAKVGVYYNYCAATVGTYCYLKGGNIDIPNTFVDADQDICPINWRMPTGGMTGEYYELSKEYVPNTTNLGSLMYNLSVSFAGFHQV